MLLTSLRIAGDDIFRNIAAPRVLSHWGWVSHICVDKLTIIGSDNGLSPDRRQAIIWTNVGMLLIGPMGTNFSEILIKTYTPVHLIKTYKSRKWGPFCLGLNVLDWSPVCIIASTIKHHKTGTRSLHTKQCFVPEESHDVVRSDIVPPHVINRVIKSAVVKFWDAFY